MDGNDKYGVDDTYDDGKDDEEEGGFLPLFLSRNDIHAVTGLRKMVGVERRDGGDCCVNVGCVVGDCPKTMMKDECHHQDAP